MLLDARDVIIPSSFMMLGWLSLRRIKISLAINLMLSGWRLSNFTFFKATIFPVSTSRARKTLLYVPCPIYNPKIITSILFNKCFSGTFPHKKHTVNLLQLLERLCLKRNPPMNSLRRNLAKPRWPTSSRMLSFYVPMRQPGKQALTNPWIRTAQSFRFPWPSVNIVTRLQWMINKDSMVLVRGGEVRSRGVFPVLDRWGTLVP